MNPILFPGDIVCEPRPFPFPSGSYRSYLTIKNSSAGVTERCRFSLSLSRIGQVGKGIPNWGATFTFNHRVRAPFQDSPEPRAWPAVLLNSTWAREHGGFSSASGFKSLETAFSLQMLGIQELVHIDGPLTCPNHPIQLRAV